MSNNLFNRLWRCPKCGRYFKNRNQSHSCGSFSLEEYLRGRSPEVLALYEKFVEAVKLCGPFNYTPAGARIGFQSRAIFAAVTLKRDGLVGHMCAEKKMEHPLFISFEPVAKNCITHHFRLKSPVEIDQAFRECLKESYKWGE